MDADDVVDRKAPLAGLERALFDEYVREQGYDPDGLEAVEAAERRRVCQGAACYASTRLSEVEARAHYVHELHGERG